MTVTLEMPEDREKLMAYIKGEEMYWFMFDWLQQQKHKLSNPEFTAQELFDDLSNQLSVNNIHPLHDL